MNLTSILFSILAIMAIGSALMMVFSKNPVHSVLWLILVFFAISGNYILLNAQFLAVVNIIVYAGAIMVLFLFVVMLMNLNAETEPMKNQRLKLIGVLLGGSLLLLMVAAVKQVDVSNPVQMGAGNEGLVSELGKVLFNQYVIPFELSSVLFLSAIIGAVLIGKKEETQESGTNS
jgi:NADH-quinone oxidoreductase subunit J